MIIRDRRHRDVSFVEVLEIVEDLGGLYLLVAWPILTVYHFFAFVDQCFSHLE